MQECVNQSPLIRTLVSEIPELATLSLRLRWRLYNLAVWEKQYLSQRGLLETQ